MADPLVETTSGRVRGRPTRHGVAFLGLPYAAAPVGELRLRRPMPVPAWTGERDCLAFGPPAPQPQRPVSDFAHGRLPAGDEDCLTLNVWTPGLRGPERPVLVWIHGGGWVTGWSGVDTYDGALLAAAAGAVVVTVNYRLGSLGWLHHPSLADDPTGPSANWGLLDQLAALRWVKANIRGFGGDPARVTLGGQSSGAANVADMLVAPGADGLFSRALLHSAPFGESGNDPRRGRSWAEDLADELELPNVAALRSAPAQRILAAHEQLLGEGRWRGTRGGAWPTLDAATLPASPAERPDARPSIDVLVGTTRDEATFMFRAGGHLEPDAAQLRAIVGQINGVEDPDGLIERYAALGGSLDANTLLVQIITEEQFRAPAARWAHARARAGGDVHLFRVDHSAPDADLGALHTVDVPLLFGTFASGEIARRFVGDDVESRAVSSAMATQWGAFLHGDDVGWPALAAGGKSLPTAVFGGPDGPLKIEHTLGEAA